MENPVGKEYDIYKDIKERTNGEIYMGLVGPVRTGKSTFIKRFMETCVITEIENEEERKRIIDELPQSSMGATIMTTEPKFIPSKGSAISIKDNMDVKVRVIDCVGFMVNGALGVYENGDERMVNTPWFDEAIPFSKAAAIGTERVIDIHSTIGIMVTCDGSFTGISRENYIKAEEETVKRLKDTKKPFVIILNCEKPLAKESVKLANELEQKYMVKVFAKNCEQLSRDDFKEILNGILNEFCVTEIDFSIPSWMDVLDSDHWLKKNFIKEARDIINNLNVIKDVKYLDGIKLDDYIAGISLKNVNTATGTISIEMKPYNNLYYKVLSELTGADINGELELIEMVKNLSEKKDNISSFNSAIIDVDEKGFSVVTPNMKDIILEEPCVIKNGNKYGVKIDALIPAINLLKTNIHVEIAPIVGSKRQADDLMEYIKDNMDNNSNGIWDTNIFGKTVKEIIDEGIKEKTSNITEESMCKITDTLEKVMNDNSGLVCLIV